MRKAVVLLSGGLDSSTTAAIAKSEGFEVYALSFDYGQRHSRELESAKAVAKSLGALDQVVMSFDMRRIGGSALTDDIEVPLDRRSEEMAEGIPATYVPARNTIFLSFALAYAETIGARDIFIGVSQVDYSGYPDCRREFVDAFEQVANLATNTVTWNGAIPAGGSVTITITATILPSAAGTMCDTSNPCPIRHRAATVRRTGPSSR